MICEKTAGCICILLIIVIIGIIIYKQTLVIETDKTKSQVKQSSKIVESFVLPTQPPNPCLLTIVSAFYGFNDGNPSHYINVLDKVNTFKNAEGTELHINTNKKGYFTIFGDPIPGVGKVFVVVYKYGNTPQQTVTTGEYSPLDIICPPEVVSTVVTTTTQYDPIKTVKGNIQSRYNDILDAQYKNIKDQKKLDELTDRVNKVNSELQKHINGNLTYQASGELNFY
jgi:hypothetical protein